MSSARQAVHLADSLRGFGKPPALSPSHQQVLPRGINLNTWGNRKNPVSWGLCPHENGSDSRFAGVCLSLESVNCEASTTIGVDIGMKPAKAAQMVETGTIRDAGLQVMSRKTMALASCKNLLVG